jgi:triosephosphate isomerase
MGGNKKLIIGNWKMNFTVKEAVSYANKLAKLNIEKNTEVVVAPHALALAKVAEVLEESDIKVASQNAYWCDEGAFTGEVSMPMLRGLAKYVLVGHSERRHVFGETDDEVMQKVVAAVRSGITPVLCVGETLHERTRKQTNQVLHHQITLGASQLTAEEVSKIVIAYEPVWAISNGKDFSKHKIATPEDVDEAQQIIRNNIAELYGTKTAEKIRVIYGASVSADSASGFLSIDGINGVLPGGASLSLHNFKPILEKAALVNNNSGSEK